MELHCSWASLPLPYAWIDGWTHPHVTSAEATKLQGHGVQGRTPQPRPGDDEGSRGAGYPRFLLPFPEKVDCFCTSAGSREVMGNRCAGANVPAASGGR